MQIETIIFDWDGTLLRTLDLWLEGYRISFQDHGYQFEDAFIAAEFFYHHDRVPERHPEIDFPPIADATRAYVKAEAGRAMLYDGAATLLTGLKARDVPFGLVTSSPREILDPALAARGLGDVFGTTLTGSCGFGHKPSPRPFEEMLTRLGAAPERTLIIGDALVDIEAGQKVGCKTCWFAPEGNRLFHDFDAIAAAGPDATITELAELGDLVA